MNNRKDRRRQKKSEPTEMASNTTAPTHPPNMRKDNSFSRLPIVISVFSLIIAGVGGIPGTIALIDHYERSSVRVIFNEEESLPCIVANSLDKSMDGRLALLLSDVTIVGKGAEHFVAYDATISIRVKGIWQEGKRFQPVQRKEPDGNGSTSSAVRLYVGVPNPTKLSQTKANNRRLDPGDTLLIGGWRGFAPGIKLGFGEPATFMIASYFPNISSNETAGYDRIRIVLRDYLKNEFSEEYEANTLQKPPFTLYLDQSAP